MGENFDETSISANKKGGRRNAELAILDIVERLSLNEDKMAQHIDVLNEAERMDIPRDKAEDIIDALNRKGTLLRPRGYDYLQRGI